METEQKQVEAAAAHVAYLQEVFDTEKGRDCLYDLCKKFHYFNSSWQGDVNEMIFREGERNVIHYLLTMLKQSPSKILDDFRKRQKEELRYGEYYESI